MKRLNKNSWLSEGFNILESDGFSRITIDRLCERQNRSKGSFYFHFKNIDGYVEALMKYWQEKNTINFIKTTDTKAKIDKKFITLKELASSISQKAEQIIRAWSFSNETVRLYMQEVDNMRIEYLIDLNIQIGMDEREAEIFATLEYSTMIGIQQLNPNISQKDFKNLYLVLRDNKLQKVLDKKMKK